MLISQEQYNKPGFLLINKPSGPTSHDVISQLRRITGIRQMGHAGTLDPFASGLLLIGIGEATKLLRHYVGMDKKYIATIKLGAVSDTFDRTGRITNSELGVAKLKKKDIKKALKSFIGKQKQIPPMYSAKKIGGKKLYELARKGEEIEREPVDIEVYDIKLVSLNSDLLTLNFHVSSGTYIRSLAHDIGQALGCGAYLEELKRTAIGNFRLKDAVATDRLTNDNWNKHVEPLKTVLVAGTFDGVHPGHRDYFRQARQYGQRLIAVVARDTTVLKVKGHAPKCPEKERIHFVKECPETDRVYLGSAGDPYNFVASLAPDVIALGYDQNSFTKGLAGEMRKRGLCPKIVRLAPFEPKKYKSSILNKTIDRTGKTG